MAESVIGKPAIRLDGRDKVTGTARYSSDEAMVDPAYAFLLTSTIAKGRIREFHLERARAIAGVLDILTYLNVGHDAQPQPGPSGGPTTTTMQDERIWHEGQIIGIVLAETYEIAREAAYAIRVEYDEEMPSATFGSAGVQEEPREPGAHEDYDTGDFDRAYAVADVKIEREYGTPTQHHNPIELFTTTCAWNGEHLTIWEPSQFVHGLRGTVAKQLGLDPEKVHVVSRLVGGAFGSRGAATSRTAWIAIAARRLQRPVKLVATRHQSYTIATYRAETRHHIRLGASRDGKLQALYHMGREITSRPSNYNVSGTDTTARMYACPNVRTRVNIAHADRNTPGFMRAPPDTPYMFALESAMDELAFELGLDPVELRRSNDTQTDPVKGVPYTSRSLMRCFDEAAARFGWKRRDPRPGSMTEGDWLVGWGCASAAYPSNIGPASARVTITPDKLARVQIGAHEIGTGALTLAAIIAADRLGLPLEAVHVELGDSGFPAANLAAGSSHSASIAHAIAKACHEATARMAQGATGTIDAYAEHVPEGMKPDSMQTVQKGQVSIQHGPERERNTAYAFGAQFVEVRVHRRTREIRVPRMVGAFAAGTIVNPLTARSQYMGGMIWGLGCALLEQTEIDERAARYVNDNIAEYLIPVNADVAEIDVILVPEHDSEVNPLGIKGIGEIGIVGVNAAIANALFHATGKRVRDLPIRLEDFL